MKHVLVCLALCAGIASSKCHAGDQLWRVGAAVVEITPPVGWRRAGGDTEVISTGVHDPLFAKALVISQGDTHCAIVSNEPDFYIPTRRAFQEGHYEPTTCPLVPGCGERLVEAAAKLLQDLKGPSGESVSAAAPQEPGQR